MGIRTSFSPMGTFGKKLPPGYIELEYLESVGCRQYIDTNIVPQADCIIETDAMFVNPESLSTVYWCREGGSYPSFACISANRPSGTMTLRVYHAMYGNAATGIYPVQLRGGERFMFKAQYNAFYVNGQQTSLPAQVQYTPVTTIGLFWMREDGRWFQNSQPSTSSSVRMYSFKVKSAGARLECNLIPALDPTGRPCMFDLVTRRPFYNEGTGEFLYA